MQRDLSAHKLLLEMTVLSNSPRGTLASLPSLARNDKQLLALIKDARQFYSLARKRDQLLFDNTLRFLSATKKQGSTPKATVLIAGGFRDAACVPE